ncbi:serine hydrolase domain-containing protein [Spongiivirga sp. MCCC 1A20706]|uniref:serine hydrolase domain-containing protein n=1 Tax=Spongiivirga sp. MCCC 1A20706 TaxID=3160963 RepID=UPI003977C859
MRTYFLLLLFLSLLLGCKEKPTATDSEAVTSQRDSLESELKSIAESKVLPGFGVSVFTKDSILYQRGFGFSNIQKETPYTTDNVQIIASVTKTLVGIALMKVVEDGLVHLDDDINHHLAFDVKNPNFPDEKITIRMLAAHTSSIGGTKKSDKGYRFESKLLASQFPEAYGPLLDVYNKDEEIALADFLKYKLSKGEKWYEKAIFNTEQPGTSYEYSNLGIALLAHIIELKTGQSFDRYAKELILDPLKMTASTWHVSEVSPEKQVTYYNEILNVVPNYHIITYPDGGLYSSVEELTLFLQEMIKGYNGESNVLSKGSFREMMRKQFKGDELPDGLCWDLSFDGLVGHSGNDFGTATLMYFNPKTGIGRILFTNISVETEAQEDAFYGVFNTLFSYDLN